MKNRIGQGFDVHKLKAGVPLIIGINWCILTLIKGAIFTLFLIIIGVKYFVEHY